MTNWDQIEHRAREVHASRLREAERERLGAVARGASTDALRCVRGRRIALPIARLLPGLRRRPPTQYGSAA